MKITKRQLRRIIKEEKAKLLSENLNAIESEIRNFHNNETPAHSAAKSLDYYGVDQIYRVLNQLSDQDKLKYYIEEILDLIENPQSASEYLYGEPDRGAGSRRY
jgi:hypothetical protein